MSLLAHVEGDCCAAVSNGLCLAIQLRCKRLERWERSHKCQGHTDGLDWCEAGAVKVCDLEPFFFFFHFFFFIYLVLERTMAEEWTGLLCHLLIKPGFKSRFSGFVQMCERWRSEQRQITVKIHQTGEKQINDEYKNWAIMLYTLTVAFLYKKNTTSSRLTFKSTNK